jgi:hypothetical protein
MADYASCGSEENDPPNEIQIEQIDTGKGRMWKVKARNITIIRSRESFAVKELLRRLNCNPATFDGYSPHKTDETKIIFTG